jgi:glutamate dehydrogenase/leucine dehydrogenase
MVRISESAAGVFWGWLSAIAFVPDYVANAGGVIDFHQEAIDDQPDAVLA